MSKRAWAGRMPENPADITALIRASSQGDSAALARLVEVVQPELRVIARRQLKRERPDHTLQCTALIHEAYMRLALAETRNWNDRAHFFGVAARVMRSILVDYARARRTAKRGAGAITVVLADQHAVAPPAAAVDVLDLHEALEQLENVDPTQSRVVELRYFGGFSVQETAEVMGISPGKVKREWLVAKTWIRRRMLGREPA